MQDLQDCLSYVQHLRLEHRRLNESLRRISALLAKSVGPNSSIAPTKLVETLTELRADLAHHFVQEETGGCIEEAVCRCPSLSSDAKGIEAQHPVLLKELDAIIQRAHSAASLETRGEFEHLADSLREHESAENRILRLGFGVGDGMD
jgi:hypothetical protein